MQSLLVTIYSLIVLKCINSRLKDVKKAVNVSKRTIGPYNLASLLDYFQPINMANVNKQKVK